MVSAEDTGPAGPDGPSGLAESLFAYLVGLMTFCGFCDMEKHIFKKF